MGIFRQFPYTNFHDLNLDWLLKEMRIALTEWAEYQEKWNVLYNDITTAFDDFKAVFDEHIAQYDAEFRSYIDSIDVNKELRIVFDQAVADGTVANIINPVIIQKTTEWLGENITQPTTPVIDSSLTISGAGADALTVGNKALHSENPNPTQYSNKMQNITRAIVGVVTASAWNDFPSGWLSGDNSAILTVYPYNNNETTVQYISAYPSMRTYKRICSTSEIYVDWTLQPDNRIAVHAENVNPADYNNLLRNVTKAYIMVVNKSQWNDYPAGMSDTASIMTVLPYNNGDMAIQYLTGYPSMKTYRRICSSSTVYADWNNIEDEIYNQVTHPEHATPNDYNNLLSNVDKPMIFGISGSGWNDLPFSGAIGILYSYRYQEFIVQNFYSYPDFKSYSRIINPSTGSAVTNWTPSYANDYETVWYALGDSITSGSYSTDDGGSVVANNAEWAYPNRIARNRKCTVHNIAQAGSALTEMSSQAALIGADATLVTITGGANDYYGKDLPLGTPGADYNYNTVCGAIKSIIQRINTVAPNARIVLISPFIIKYGTLATKWSTNFASRAGWTYQELSDAMKGIAVLFNLEFIDGTHQSPVNYINIGSVLKDNVHPTKEFYNTIANYIESKLF